MPEFQEIINTLNQAEKNRVLDLINALRTPVQIWRNPNSNYVSSEFIECFNSMLLTQHVLLSNPLFQDTFEQAFIDSCRSAGRVVQRANDGQRFYDVTVDSLNISLKSTKEKGLRDGFLKISKLTEAAWIQDCRSARQRRDQTFDLFNQYSSIVSSIFQLRYFATRNFYELVEIPTLLFNAIQATPLEYFNADGPSINIPIGEDPPHFTLKLDRSDAKITLNNILKARCMIHATWQF